MSAALRKDDVKVLGEIEHILKRPQIMIGSVISEEKEEYVYSPEGKLTREKLSINEGLMKIFCEILDNAVDESIRTGFKYADKISVTFDKKTREISVHDNGRGLPINFREELKKWTPEIIYTQLRSGSNFDDDTKGQVIGQNGVGSSVTCIFSSSFSIDTANGVKRYRQTYEGSLSKIGTPKISDCDKNYTEVTFTPLYHYFKIDDAGFEIFERLIQKRVRDLAFCYPEIQFKYNRQRVVGSDLKKFLNSIHEVYEFSQTESARLGVFFSEDDFQQISFVNGAYTKRAGTHIDIVSDKIVGYLTEYIRKKHKFNVKPSDIRTKLFIILSIRMNDPRFDSQTKERLVNPNPDVRSIVDDIVTEKFLKSITKNEEILAPIIESYRLQQQVKENIQLKKMGAQKKIKVDKFFKATKECKYLMLCEGDSASGGLSSSIGREFYSYFPLKGKPLNTLEVPISKIVDNDEFKNIVTILGIQLGVEKEQELSHEFVCIAADQDLDGISIRGLLLCFFYRFARWFLSSGKLKFLRTPLVIGVDAKGSVKEIFFDLPTYKEFSKDPKNLKGLTFKYMKGLGSWTPESLSDIVKKFGINHFIQDFVLDEEAEVRIKGWLGKEGIDFRKDSVRNNSFDINTL